MSKCITFLILSYCLVSCTNQAVNELKINADDSLKTTDTTAAEIKTAETKSVSYIYKGNVASGNDSILCIVTINKKSGEKGGTFELARESTKDKFKESGTWITDSSVKYGKMYVLTGKKTELPAYYLIKDSSLVALDNIKKQTREKLNLTEIK